MSCWAKSVVPLALARLLVRHSLLAGKRALPLTPLCAGRPVDRQTDRETDKIQIQIPARAHVRHSRCVRVSWKNQIPLFSRRCSSLLAVRIVVSVCGSSTTRHSLSSLCIRVFVCASVCAAVVCCVCKLQGHPNPRHEEQQQQQQRRLPLALPSTHSLLPSPSPTPSPSLRHIQQILLRVLSNSFSIQPRPVTGADALFPFRVAASVNAQSPQRQQQQQQQQHWQH